MSLKDLANGNGCIDRSDSLWRYEEEHMEQILTFKLFLTSSLFELQLFEFWVSYFQRRGFFFFNFPLKNFCNDRFTSQYLIQELHRIRFQNFHQF